MPLGRCSDGGGVSTLADGWEVHAFWPFMNFRIGDGPTADAAALTARFTTFSFSTQASSAANGADVVALGDTHTLDEARCKFSSSDDDSLADLSGNKWSSRRRSLLPLVRVAYGFLAS